MRRIEQINLQGGVVTRDLGESARRTTEPDVIEKNPIGKCFFWNARDVDDAIAKHAAGRSKEWRDNVQRNFGDVGVGQYESEIKDLYRLQALKQEVQKQKNKYPDFTEKQCIENLGMEKKLEYEALNEQFSQSFQSRPVYRE